MLVILYAGEIIAGRKTIEQVPKMLQTKVRKQLEDWEVAEAE